MVTLRKHLWHFPISHSSPITCVFVKQITEPGPTMREKQTKIMAAADCLAKTGTN